MEDKAEYDFISQVRLVSKLERQRNLEWKMLSIETIYERDSIIPAGPISSTLSINSAGRRDSYKYTTWVLERSGFEIRNDLPGTDDPETVDRKMDELFQWLKSWMLLLQSTFMLLPGAYNVEQRNYRPCSEKSQSVLTLLFSDTDVDKTNTLIHKENME